MDCRDSIISRRSIRKFKAGIPVPDKDVRLLLEAAMMAPSAVNSRPWEFIVVTDEKAKEGIMKAHEYSKMLKTAPLAIVVCGKPECQAELDVPFWPQDCAAAIENILLQATALGYGSCWCGCYPVESRVKGLQELFDLKSIPVAVIAIGVADESPKAKGFFDEEAVRYI